MKDIDLLEKEFITEKEGMALSRLSRKTFRRWAEEIGARRKIIPGPHGRVLYLTKKIVDAINSECGGKE